MATCFETTVGSIKYNILLYVLPVDLPIQAEQVLGWILIVHLIRDSAFAEPPDRFGFSVCKDDRLPRDPLGILLLILLVAVLQQRLLFTELQIIYFRVIVWWY